MLKYAVFGHPINHSLSPLVHIIFAAQFGIEISYTTVDVLPSDFMETVDQFFDNGGSGINCTSPLKELAWAYSGGATDRSNTSMSVNMLTRTSLGVEGDNTDGIGLIRDLSNHNVSLFSKRVLVLGAGGACKNIIHDLLQQYPTSIVISNRTHSKAVEICNMYSTHKNIFSVELEQLDKVKPFDVIINCTSARLRGQELLLPTDILIANGVCYDLSYSSSPTEFVQWGIDSGASQSIDGLGMLVEQAAESFLLWHGVKPNTQHVVDTLRNHVSFKS